VRKSSTHENKKVRGEGAWGGEGGEGVNTTTKGRASKDSALLRKLGRRGVKQRDETVTSAGPMDEVRVKKESPCKKAFILQQSDPNLTGVFSAIVGERRKRKKRWKVEGRLTEP